MTEYGPVQNPTQASDMQDTELQNHVSSLQTEVPLDNWRKIEIRYSLLAVLVAMISLIFTVYQDYQNGKEEIIIHSFGIDYDQDIVFYNEKDGSARTYIKYDMLFSNTSSNTISVIDTRVEITKSSDTSFNKAKFYTKDGTPLELPIILAAGESKEVKIDAYTTMSKDIYERIKASYKKINGEDLKSNTDILNEKMDEAAVPYRKITEAASLEGVDIYGNNTRTVPESAGDEDGPWVNEANFNEWVYPQYKLTLKTVNSNYFEHIYDDNVWNNEDF